MRLRSSIVAWLCFVLSWLAAGAPCHAGDRIATIIGNSAYDGDWGRLKNARKDAEDVARGLRKLGFEVDDQYDATSVIMNDAINMFFHRASNAQIALFYFAGHGFTLSLDDKKEGQIVPVGHKLYDVNRKLLPAVSVDDVIYKASGDSVTFLFFLDSCRDTPQQGHTPQQLERGTSLLVQRGISDINISNEANILVAYATAIGSQASDGIGSNGPFAKALLDKIATPNVSANMLLRYIEDTVGRETHQGQKVKVRFSGSPSKWEVVLNPGSTSATAKAKAPPDTPAETEALATKTEQSNVGAAQSAMLTAPSPPYRPPSAASSRQDCPDCPVMASIPPGAFLMGSTDGDPDEAIVHRVNVTRGFYMSVGEITFAEWGACVAVGGCQHTPDDRGWGRGANPVMNVSWQDAQDYVGWLSSATGRRYRLPSEAEWEYAAKSGGNEDVRGSAGGALRPSPAGTSMANRFGLVHMLGNVAEWVADCETKSYRNAPADQRPQESGACHRRGVRGGAWYDSAPALRAANRAFEDTSRRAAFIGFRVVRDAP